MSILADQISQHFKSNPTSNEVEEGQENLTHEATNDSEAEEKEVENKESENEEVEVDKKDESEDIELGTDSEEKEEVKEEEEESEESKDLSFEDEPKFDVSKYTEGEFENIEDLVNEYRSLKESVVSTDDIMETLNTQTLENYGLTFTEVAEWKSTDYDSMSEFDVLTEHLQMQDPDISQIEIDAELAEFDLLKKSETEIKEMIEDETISQTDYDRAVAKFTKKVRTGRTELKEYRDNLDFDNIKLPIGSKKEEKVDLPTEEEIAQHKEKVKSEIFSFSNLKVNLGSKEEKEIMAYAITDDEKQSLFDTVTDNQWILNRWKKEDGTIDRTKAYKDALILTQFQKLSKAIYSEGLAKGAKQTVMNEDNINLKDGRQIRTEQSTSIKDISDKVSGML